ncbi:hypothetical protein THAOC_35290, partial [Thalassiosira oceanica]
EVSDRFQLERNRGVCDFSIKDSSALLVRPRVPVPVSRPCQIDEASGSGAAYAVTSSPGGKGSFEWSPHQVPSLCIRKSQASSIMSCVPVAADGGEEVCVNCGKQGSDTVKLKDCKACRLVKYCGVDCQRAHRKQLKKACKQRAAELKDEELYSQGHERPERDFCPLCTLPIPLPIDDHSVFEFCCMKRICNGCDIAAQKRGMNDCAFCRTPCPDNDADKLAMIRARVVKKDPEAIFSLAQFYFHGELGLQKNMQKAVELYTEAAEVGSVDALFNIGVAYYFGSGVEKNTAKAVEFYEKAAMQGGVEARHILGEIEGNKGNHDRALRHLLISAKMGDKESLETIKRVFMRGQATKEQYAEALKGYQDAVEGMKSHDRDEANRFFALLDARKQTSTQSE